MDLFVIKRDGCRVRFNIQRIQDAIFAAAKSVQQQSRDHAVEMANKVQKILITQDVSSEHAIEIHTIQNTVEDVLMQESNKLIARAYIEYRHQRDIARETQSILTNEIKGLIEQSNESLLNENANKDSKVIPTQRDLLAGIVAKHYAKQHILPRDIVHAHEAGDIHYHDLDYAPFFPMFNCMLIDLDGMLTLGFKMGNAEIETPKSITTATAVTAQIIAQVASHIYGGTTINRIDEILAPYVTASFNKNTLLAQEWSIPNKAEFARSRTEKECFDAFQSLEYEVNTLHTANGQTPFVTFGFGLGTSWEARLIQQAILKNRIAGLGKNHKTAVFPKLVFAIKDGLNHKSADANYDIKQLALECASKRMYPDILNYDQVVKITGSFKTPMGCRSFLGTYEEQGELVHEGRNNLGVVSLNLPRIAIQAKGDESRFYQLLDERLILCKRALETRISRLKGVKARVAPILYMEGACGVRLQADDEILDIFKHGRASISLGYIGLHEAINALFGNNTHPYDSAALQKKAIAMLKHMKASTEKWSIETGYAYSLYATPSENLCSRFAKLDKTTFGDIKDVTDKGYYTNSFHLDVEKQVNPFDKIDFEMPYPAISNGGFICYGEYPNMQHNIEALEDVWDYSYSRVPYYGTNTPIDECYECGYTGEFECTSKGFTCPKCGNHDAAKVSVTRRVCGYLGSPDARPFNEGKQEEVKRRVKHL
ncbi:anaerobic ribonucleoside triphosphate reductase [Moritella sp. PE36]|uniref:anaerobic ribonucleoside-triphosphate reductase n=1 Tax=Moritella sp. PE36 TaxID=58051 RepID=UPI0001569554|nr:anaerobic ribonucleoside-triphosphate reductase [Moritella sp. PE36]EDM65217.1 anaerobic ribonucleoside triphosphate reductase [Moritella sp. PE36]